MSTMPEPAGRGSWESIDEAAVRKRLGQLSFLLDCRRAAAEVIDVLVDLSEGMEASSEMLLLREGDVRGTEGYVLLDGRVQVIKSEHEPVTLEAPALIGEMQQFSISGSRSASVMTDGVCKLLRFDWPAFYVTLEGRVRPLDFQQVKDAIRRCSWNHAIGSNED